VLLAIAGLLFGWSVRNGQYDDLDSPAQRILFDDDEHMVPKPTQNSDQNKDQNQDKHD
jgi:cbb3-type cytochrome oxidase maturation protein